MSDLSNIDFEKLTSRPGYLIRRLHQIHVAIFIEECNEHNLTPVQFGVLTVLDSEEALDQVTIASKLGIDRNNAADVIRRLEKRGLLERHDSLGDKRAKLAKITKAGLEVVDLMHPQMVAAQRRLAEPLSEEEYYQFISLMNKVIVGNNEASRAPLRDMQHKQKKRENSEPLKTEWEGNKTPETHSSQ